MKAIIVSIQIYILKTSDIVMVLLQQCPVTLQFKS